MNVDLSFIDEQLLSFPLGEFGGIDLPEVESILNEIERGYSTGSESSSNHSDQFAYASCTSASASACSGSLLQTSKKPVTTSVRIAPGQQRSNKIRQTGGVSLLAKPPRKLRKRPPSGTSLLSLPAKRCFSTTNDGDSSFVASAAATAPDTYPTDVLPFNFVPTVVCTGFDETTQVDHDYCLPLAQRPLLLPVEEIASSPVEPSFHDVDAYFNSFFTLDNMSESENTLSCTESSIVSDLESPASLLSDFGLDSQDEREEIEQSEVSMQEIDIENEEQQQDSVVFDCEVQMDLVKEEMDSLQEPSAAQGCIDLNDLNNYELSSNGHDASECNESSLDGEEEQVVTDEEDEEMLSSTEILLDEMFHSDLSDVEQNDLIEPKRSINASRPLNKSNSASSMLSSGNQSIVSSSNVNRNRTRTISASYSVRSNSACSCCSDELSDDEPQVLMDSRSQISRSLVNPSKSNHNSLLANGHVHRRINVGRSRLQSLSATCERLEKSPVNVPVNKQSTSVASVATNETKRSDFNRRKRPQLANVLFVGNIPDGLNKRDLRFWISRFSGSSNSVVTGGKTPKTNKIGNSANKFGNGHSSVRQGVPRSACIAYRKPSTEASAFESICRKNDDSRRPNLFLGRPRIESRTHTIEIDTLLLSSVERSRC